MTDTPDPETEPDNTSALFATIHFRSDQRPDGYTDDEIAVLNKLANAKNAEVKADEGPA